MIIIQAGDALQAPGVTLRAVDRLSDPSSPILFRRSSTTATLDNNSRPARRAPHWHWLLGVLLLVALVCGIVLAVSWSSTANRRLADAIAVADRNDPHWRLNDLLAHREEVPEEENSAVILADLRALLPDDWPAVQTAAPGRAGVGAIAARLRQGLRPVEQDA